MEPARRAKIKLELQILRLFRRRFAAQRAQMLAYLAQQFPERKSILDAGFLFGMFETPEERARFEGDLLRLVLVGAQGGIELFRQNVSLAMDYTLINADALEWARAHAGELITKIDETTRQAARQVVEQFVNTPGMTIGDLRNSLPFSPERAQTIAVTEVTNSFGQGAQVAGERLKRDYPDVAVLKKWYTNQDDKVCPLCGPLGDRNEWIPFDEPFAIDPKQGPIMAPARHVNCRCWMATRTDITGRANG